MKIATHWVLDLKWVELWDFNEEQITDVIWKFWEVQYKEHKQQKKLKELFRKALIEYQTKEEKKIVIFIDELDRCRPTYAIEVLERIKHLFGVAGYVFVISLDKEQLSHSIATIYGAKMDSNWYLRRFFDLEYKLPITDKIQYVDIMIWENQLDVKYTEHFWEYIKSYIKYFDLTPREIEKLFYTLKLFIPVFSKSYFKEESNRIRIYLYSIWAILSFLIILKFRDNKLFSKIQKWTLDEKEIAEYLLVTPISDEYRDYHNKNFGTYISLFLRLCKKIINKEQLGSRDEFDVGKENDFGGKSLNLMRLFNTNPASNKIEILDIFDFIWWFKS